MKRITSAALMISSLSLWAFTAPLPASAVPPRERQLLGVRVGVMDTVILKLYGQPTTIESDDTSTYLGGGGGAMGGNPYGGRGGAPGGMMGGGSTPYGNLPGMSGGSPYGGSGSPYGMGMMPGGGSGMPGGAAAGATTPSTIIRRLPIGGGGVGAAPGGAGGMSPYGGSSGMSPYGGSGGGSPYGGSGSMSPYGGSGSSSPYGGGASRSPYGGSGSPYGGSGSMSPYGGGGRSPYMGGSGVAPSGYPGSGGMSPYGGGSGGMSPYGGGPGGPMSAMAGGGAAQQPADLDQGEIKWIYKKGNNIKQFFFTKDGHCIQIESVGYTNGGKTQGGVKLGDTQNKIMSAYGFTNKIYNNDVVDMYGKTIHVMTMDYSDTSNCAFDLIDRGNGMGFRVVRITVALMHKDDM